MVTGSARSPITMASFGGAATAPEAKTTARITRDSVATRRIVMGGSFGRSSCLKELCGAILAACTRGPRTLERSSADPLAPARGEGEILENQVPPVDDERVAGVI